jgi:hypothetical protein
LFIIDLGVPHDHIISSFNHPNGLMGCIIYRTYKTILITCINTTVAAGFGTANVGIGKIADHLKAAHF